jgi:D-lactate dehydrogenase
MDTVRLADGFDAICVFVNDKLGADVIAELKVAGVKTILLRCAGFNNVDLVAAAEAGLNVCRVPAYSPEAVAEHCLALMLTLSRKTHKAYNRVRDDNFDLNGLLGINLSGKTVGLLGCGKIGKAMAKILTGFGCNVLVTDPMKPEGNFTLVDADTLFASSDVISLHVPLTPSTHHIINRDTIAKMKRGVMIINTSRGALLDTPSCIDALKTGQIGYLGLDVYEMESEIFFRNRSEEVMQDDVFARLMTFNNVLITGHQAFFTQEALREIVQTTFFNLDECRKGKYPLTNSVIEQAKPVPAKL